MKEWAKRQKDTEPEETEPEETEPEETEKTEDNTNSEDEYPSPAEVAAAMTDQSPKEPSAEPEGQKISGAPPGGRKR